MRYIDSNLPKVVESYRLLRRSLDPKGQAKRMFSTFESFRAEFDLQGKSLLELGAGGRDGLIYLFDDSNDVIGIDKYVRRLAEGRWKAAKSTVRRLFFDPVYKYYLKKLNNGKLYKRKVLLMDATDLKFPDESFEVIYSRYLLEHIDAIDKVASEAYRCLRRGGITYHIFALYTALDGAHSLDWRKYSPWHHLIGHVPGNVYINKYRLSTYKDAFERVFSSPTVKIRLSVSEKAQALLTPERYARLRCYSKEELLASSVELIAAKS